MGPARLSRPGRPGERFAVCAILLGIAFGKPLWDWGCFVAGSDLFSHGWFVPFISLYLIWLKRKELPAASAPAPGWAALWGGIGALALAAYWGLAWRLGPLDPNDYLALTTFSLWCCLVGAGCLCLGTQPLRAVAFPVAFLLFMVPLPTAWANGIEVFFQHTSAYAASGLIQLSGTPLVREGLVLRLPGIVLQVGQECSGIHSSLVLFMTSLLAGHLFLRSPWRRAVLVFAVIPLGILRNGFRIFTIAMLCVHVRPEMIGSVLHRRGGPLFFVLALVPFFLLVWYLRRREAGGSRRPAALELSRE